MAQQTFDISLKDASFPMLSEDQTRTIINTKDNELRPAVAYCHNVMPTAYGMQSVGYQVEVFDSEVTPEGVTFSDVKVVYGSDRTRLHVAWDIVGLPYILLEGASFWSLPTNPRIPVPDFNIDNITTGTVNGVTYIKYYKGDLVIYNEGTNTFDTVVMLGLTSSAIVGIASSYGYLIAYTEEAIAWSSTINPLDFVPSPITGAGGGNVDGLAGNILFATTTSTGLLIYTEANTVAANYTGNAIFPFKFREVQDSKGGISISQVAYDANSVAQYSYSKAGLQALTSQKAETILPGITDFLGGRRMEDYIESLNQFAVVDIPTDQKIKKQITLVASRYLVISYGIGLFRSPFTHALVLDIALNKLGKLKREHIDVIDFVGNQVEPSKASIGLVSKLGAIRTVSFDTAQEAEGVLILGKLQFSHGRRITLERVIVENSEDTVGLGMQTQAYYDGKNFNNVIGNLSYYDGYTATFHFHTDAVCHSLVFVGKFDINTVLVNYVVTGIA